VVGLKSLAVSAAAIHDHRSIKTNARFSYQAFSFNYQRNEIAGVSRAILKSCVPKT
jgi:hypothetical protein